MWQWLLMIALFSAPPAAATWLLGRGIRRSKTRLAQFSCWLTLAGVALFCWLLLLPATRRTNEPLGAGIVFHFLIRWGPLVAFGWLMLQQVIRSWEQRRGLTRRGFPVGP